MNADRLGADAMIPGAGRDEETKGIQIYFSSER